MDELYRLVSDRCVCALKRLNADKLSEVRVRNARPISVCYGGAYYFLCDGGITRDMSEAITAGAREAESVVMRACDRSLYTVSETLKQGYIAVSGGIRIGVCGTYVTDRGGISALKDFSSVDIRLPHEVKGCAFSLFNKVYSGTVLNTLIISPPGAGKTTALRDLCRLISDRGTNVLLADERHELASPINGVPALDVGACTDVVCGAEKSAVFDMAVRSMRPDVVMADELFGRDAEAVWRAAHCGIAVVATVHARDIDDFFSKPEYAGLTERGVFSRYAVISAPPHRAITVYDGERAV